MLLDAYTKDTGRQRGRAARPAPPRRRYRRTAAGDHLGQLAGRRRVHDLVLVTARSSVQRGVDQRHEHQPVAATGRGSRTRRCSRRPCRTPRRRTRARPVRRTRRHRPPGSAAKVAAASPESWTAIRPNRDGWAMIQQPSASGRIRLSTACSAIWPMMPVSGRASPSRPSAASSSSSVRYGHCGELPVGSDDVAHQRAREQHHADDAEHPDDRPGSRRRSGTP